MSDLPTIINYKKATQLTDLGSFNQRKEVLNLEKEPRNCTETFRCSRDT